MNNVEPIRNQQKIYAIKQHILGDKYNPAYRERDYLLIPLWEFPIYYLLKLKMY